MPSEGESGRAEGERERSDESGLEDGEGCGEVREGSEGRGEAREAAADGELDLGGRRAAAAEVEGREAEGEGRGEEADARVDSAPDNGGCGGEGGGDDAGEPRVCGCR